MSDKYQKVQEIKNIITDQDKVEIAGMGAYLTTEESHKSGPLLKSGSLHTVNGKTFRVGDVYNNSITGVNYSTWTLVNDEGNFIEPVQTVFAVQGSNALPPSKERDAIDDANLSSGITPEQYQLTLDKFNELNSVRATVGLPKIKDVTGNSLGGGVANYIGYHTDGVNVVSLNPATVPNPPKGKNNDVISVISTDDFLNMLQSGVGYAKSGTEYRANGFGWGSADLLGLSFTEIMTMAITYGHTGYDEKRTGLGYQLDNLGLSTSFLTGNLLVDKATESENLPVYIDANSIRNLVWSLQTKGNEQLKAIGQALKNIDRTAVVENADLDKRIKYLMDYFNQTINTSLGGWAWVLEDKSEDKLAEIDSHIAEMDNLVYVLNTFLSPIKGIEKLATLGSYIPVLGIVFEHIENASRRIAEAQKRISEIPGDIMHCYSILAHLKSSINDDVPKLFKSAHAGNNDGIPLAIQEHTKVLKNINYPLIAKQYNNYLLTAVGIANSLEAMDSELSSNLEKLHVVKTDTSELEHDLSAALETPEALQAAKVLIEKERQLNKNFNEFNSDVAYAVKSLCSSLSGLFSKLETLAHCLEILAGILKTLVDVIRGLADTEKFLLSKIGLGWIMDPLISCANNINGKIGEFVEQIENIKHSDALRNGKRIVGDFASGNHAYNLIQNVKPVVNMAIFSDSSMITVQTSAKAALSLAMTLREEFTGIMLEISHENSVQGINDLVTGSIGMSWNLMLFANQLDVLAF